MIKSLYPKFQKWSEKGSIYIISDTHFDDADCKYMDPNWVEPKKHIDFLKKHITKNDVLIHLGDVGNANYIDELKCYKILISGNHDILSKVTNHFDEVYNGPLFIADRILLSHEPIIGLEDFCINIHGHLHGHYTDPVLTNHINLASNIYGFDKIFSLGTFIKNGGLKNIKNYHRFTIDNATHKKEEKNV